MREVLSGHPRRAELGQAEHISRAAAAPAGQVLPPRQGSWERPPSFRSPVAGSLLLPGKQEGLQKGWEGSGFRRRKAGAGQGCCWRREGAQRGRVSETRNRQRGPEGAAEGSLGETLGGGDVLAIVGTCLQ